jgi:hypothetical protein
METAVDHTRVADRRGPARDPRGLRCFIDNAPGFSCVLSFETVEAALPALTPASVDDPDGGRNTRSALVRAWVRIPT